MSKLFSRISWVLLIGVTFYSSLAVADEFETSKRQITNIKFYAETRPSNPTYVGFAAITLGPGTIPFGVPTGCDPETFAVLNTDKGMFSALLSAKISNTPVIIAVEKSLVHAGDFCQIVKVEM